MWGLALLYLGWRPAQSGRKVAGNSGEGGGTREDEPADLPGNSGELEGDLEGHFADDRVDFDASGANQLEIHYADFQGEKTVFLADRRTIRAHEKRISACIAPDGRRVIFDSDRIINMAEVDAAILHAGMN